MARTGHVSLANDGRQVSAPKEGVTPDTGYCVGYHRAGQADTSRKGLLPNVREAVRDGKAA